MAENTELTQSNIESKPPQISPDVLADLNLSQAEIDSHYKNKEQQANADAALNKGDWKTAVTIYDEIKDGGIGGPNAHDVRVKIAEMFKENADTRREVAEHIQSLIDAKVNKEPTMPEPTQVKEQTPPNTEQQTTIKTPPTLETPNPKAEVTETPLATPTPVSSEPASIISPQPEPEFKRIVSFPHLATSRTTSPTAPEPTPILNISGEVNLNPTSETSQPNDLRAAPPNPLNQAA